MSLSSKSTEDKQKGQPLVDIQECTDNAVPESDVAHLEVDYLRSRLTDEEVQANLDILQQPE